MSAIINPFIITGKIPKEYFCDRSREVAMLSKYLINGHNVLLTSPRRMGKTGLINYVYSSEAISDNYLTFFIDILQTNTLSEFAYIFGKEIFNTLKPKGRRFVESFIHTLRSISGKISYDSISGAPTFDIHLGDITRPEYLLNEIFEYLEKSKIPCIVAIDEFQQIGKYPEKNTEAILRTHIQRLSHTNFIFAGSERHLLLRMFADHNRPFYNSTSIINLEAIPFPEYSKFVVSNFNTFGRSIDSDIVAYVYDTMGGNTFCMQRVFNLAFASILPGERCGMEIIDRTIEEIIASNDFQYRERFATMPESRKKVLIAISSKDKVERITSTEFLQQNALGSASIVQSAVRRLIADDIVVREGNSYFVADRIFQMWLRKIYG